MLPLLSYYHITKGPFTVVPYTQCIVSTFQPKKLQGMLKGKKHSLKIQSKIQIQIRYVAIDQYINISIR